MLLTNVNDPIEEMGFHLKLLMKSLPKRSKRLSNATLNGKGKKGI